MEKGNSAVKVMKLKKKTTLLLNFKVYTFSLALSIGKAQEMNN